MVDSKPEVLLGPQRGVWGVIVDRMALSEDRGMSRKADNRRLAARLRRQTEQVVFDVSGGTDGAGMALTLAVSADREFYPVVPWPPGREVCIERKNITQADCVAHLEREAAPLMVPGSSSVPQLSSMISY